MTYSKEEYREGKRLHPLTLLYKAVTNSPSIIIPIYLATVQGNKEEWIYIVITFIVLTVTLPNIILSYFYFSFYINPKEIVIRSGVFSRKQRNVPLKKIQNINIEQNILMRMLGLTKVILETAGDIKSEGVLECVSKSDAEEIKQIIKSYQYEIEKTDNIEENQTNENHTSNVNEIEEAGEQIQNSEDELFSLSFRDTIYYGAMRLRPVVLILAFWFMSFSFQFDFLPNPEELGLIEFINQITSLNPLFIFAYIIVLLISMIVFTIILDIILTINQYYNFKLIREDSKLYTKFGLLTKRHGTIPLKKLQSLSIITNPIKKKFNYYTLALQTAGFGEKGSNSEAAIPFGKKEILENVINKIFNFKLPDKFHPVSKITIRRAFVRYSFVLGIITFLFFAISSFQLNSMYNLLWLSILLPLFWIAAVLRYQYRGFALEEDKIIIKQGFWIQKTTVIQIKKIQTLNIKQTIFQRRLNLATLNIDTASTSLLADASIVDISTDDARNLMDILLRRFNDINK